MITLYDKNGIQIWIKNKQESLYAITLTTRPTMAYKLNKLFKRYNEESRFTTQCEPTFYFYKPQIQHIASISPYLGKLLAAEVEPIP